MGKRFILPLLVGCLGHCIGQPTDNDRAFEKELSIAVKGCTLQGSLCIPGPTNPGQKILLIIAGSGPTDRNGNSGMGVTTNAYKLLASALAKSGIASFRYDKRAVGKSIPKGFKEKDLDFEDYIRDAATIVDYLRDSMQYRHIYVAGHSEGSLIGIAVSSLRRVSGFISLCGAGRPIDVVINEQLKGQPDYVKVKVDSIFGVLKTGKTVDTVPPYLFSLFRPSVQPYMISWLRYDPATLISKLKCPALIVQGTCDVQVKVEDAIDLHQAYARSKLDTITPMTHTLKDAQADCQDPGNKTYLDGTLPLDARLVTDVVGFIEENK